MEKKNYKKPEMKAFKMECLHMIADSDSGNEGDGGGSRETNGFWSSEE